MTALASDRGNVKVREGTIRGHKVAGGVVIYKHALVCKDADGYIVPAANTTGYSNVIGVAVSKVDNAAGADGAKSIHIRSGISINVKASGATQALDDNSVVYVTDDQTVTTTAGNGIKAGFVEAVLSATEVRIFVPLGGMGG